MGVKQTVTIRIDPEVKVMLDMVVAEHSLETGNATTQSQAILHLVEVGSPNVFQRVAELIGSDRIEAIKTGKRVPKSKSK